MAKTDWKMDDTVMPADMNQVGEEINKLGKDVNRALNYTSLWGIQMSVDDLMDNGDYLVWSNAVQGLPDVFDSQNVVISVRGVKSPRDFFTQEVFTEETISYDPVNNKGGTWRRVYNNGLYGPWVLVDPTSAASIPFTAEDFQSKNVQDAIVEVAAVVSDNKDKLDTATNVATADAIVKRDASGRAKVAAPAASDDIARKAEVDAVIALAQMNKLTLDNGTLSRYSGDLNALTDVTRIYYCNNDATNKPVGFPEGLLEVFRLVVGPDRTIQRVTAAISLRRWIRVGVGGVWGNWIEDPLNNGALQTNLNAEMHNGWKRYSSLSELGLLNSSTIDEIFAAMPINSILEYVSVSQAPPLYPYGAGIVKFEKVNTTRMHGVFTRGVTTEPKFYRSTYTSDGATKWSGWIESASIDSPAFTGTPSGPTAAVGTNTTQLATTEFVQRAANIAESNGKFPNISEKLVSDPPSSYPNGYSVFHINTPANGWPIAYAIVETIKTTSSRISQFVYPTQSSSGSNNIFYRLQTTTTSGVWSDWFELPNKNSPAFTGTPTAPTPASGSNDTKIATTAFVQTEIDKISTIKTHDNRAIKPNNVNSTTFRPFLSSYGGMTTGTNNTEYLDVLAINGWTDSSAGKVNALAFSKKGDGIYHFQGAFGGTSWDTPKKLAYVDMIRPIATQAQAEAGTDNATDMTPLRVKQAIANLAPGISGLRSSTLALGSSANASYNSVALGLDADASGSTTVALGSNAVASSSSAVALGCDSQATSTGGTAVGKFASALDNFDVAVGYKATTSNGTAVGNGAEARNSAVALGSNTSATAQGSSAIGSGASAANANEGVLGGTGVGHSRNWRIPGTLTVSGTKNFEIPHPAPNKKHTHVIRHGAVESPTAGDTLYRYTVRATTDGETVEVQLPDYFEHLNANVDVWVNGHMHFGRAYGWVEGDTLKVTCEKAGEYKALVIGTRNDDNVQDWHVKGVEREIGESWLGETYVFSVDEIIEIDEIKEELA